MRRRRAGWIDVQLRARGISDPRVLGAMARVPREQFVPAEVRTHAYDDAALPLAHGQTISQPFVVALIAEALALEGDETVLDVGTGSGYQAAVLAELARHVHSIERIAELAEAARENLARAGYERVRVHVGDGTLGLPEHAPYDGIAVAAAAPGVPAPLVDQLREGARLVVPVGTPREQELRVVERSPGGPRVLRSAPVRFVPLVGAEGYDV